MWDNKYIPLKYYCFVPEQEHNAEKHTKGGEMNFSSFVSKGLKY